jgi:hypothetical protein
VGGSVVAAKEGGNLACDEFTLLLMCDVVIATTTHLAPMVFFFFFPAILSYTQSDDDPKENLCRFGYKPKMKVIFKKNIPGLKFWPITSTMHLNLAVYLFFFSNNGY